jgi:DNA topoisomerase-1
LKAKDQAFKARLTHFEGEKLKQFSITDGERAEQVKQALVAAADGQLLVEKLEKKQRKRNPAAPFITSTLQQEASRKLGFTTKKTMMVAQQLYEGIEVLNNFVN